MTATATHTVAVDGIGPVDVTVAVGIEVPDHPVADFFALTMDQVFALSFHNPEPFRFDPTTLPPAAQAIAAGTGPPSPRTPAPR